MDTTNRLHFHFSLSCIGEGNGNPLQCSCLENPRDGGARWAAVYGVTQSRTGLKRLSSSSSIGKCLLILNGVLYIIQGNKTKRRFKKFPNTFSAFDKHSLVFILIGPLFYVKFLYLVFYLNVQPTINSWEYYIFKKS